MFLWLCFVCLVCWCQCHVVIIWCVGIVVDFLGCMWTLGCSGMLVMRYTTRFGMFVNLWYICDGGWCCFVFMVRGIVVCGMLFDYGIWYICGMRYACVVWYIFRLYSGYVLNQWRIFCVRLSMITRCVSRLEGTCVMRVRATWVVTCVIRIWVICHKVLSLIYVADIYLCEV